MKKRMVVGILFLAGNYGLAPSLMPRAHAEDEAAPSCQLKPYLKMRRVKPRVRSGSRNRSTG